MSIPQKKFRELIFQVLYTKQFTNYLQEDGASLIMRELKISKKVFRDAFARAEEILRKLPEIDQLINDAAIDYEFERISSIEKNILRLGIFELQYDDTIPPKVVLSEALRICRKYGSSDSIAFVNGILDKIYKTHGHH